MVKSVKEFFKRILIIAMIMITLIFFVIEPYAEAAQLPAEGEFYYAGTQNGVFVVTENIFAWLQSCLRDIIDWILGFMTMAFRMSFVGWATIFEWLLTRTLESSTGLEFYKDALSETNMTSTNDSSQNVTVEAIVYNRVPLFDVNFFKFEIDPNKTGTGRDLTKLECDKCKKKYEECTCEFGNDSGQCACTCCRTKNAVDKMILNADKENVVVMIKKTIAEWFQIMRAIALAGMLCVLILIGIKIAVSSLASEKAVYKRMLVDWLAGMAFLFLVQYIMLFIILLNELLVGEIEKYATGDNSPAAKVTKIEFAEAAKSNEDLEISVYEAVRSRAYDIKLINGLTGTVMYITLVVFAWRFSWMYLKRYFTLIVLTLMGPGVAFSYALQKVFTGKAKSWSNWLHEYIVNVLIQTVHAIIYSSFVSMALAISLNSLAGMIVAFILMNFMLKADKIFRKIFKMSEGGSLLDKVSNGAEEARLDRMVKSAQSAVMAAKPVAKLAKKSPAAVAMRSVGQYAGAGVVAAGSKLKHRRDLKREEKIENRKENQLAQADLRGAQTQISQADALMDQVAANEARAEELRKNRKEKNWNKSAQNLDKQNAELRRKAEKLYDDAARKADSAMNRFKQTEQIAAMLPDEKAARAQELATKEQNALYKAMLAKEQNASSKETIELFNEYKAAKKERKNFDRLSRGPGALKTAADNLFDYDKYFDANGTRKVSFEYDHKTGEVKRKGLRSNVGANLNMQSLLGISPEEQKLKREALAASASGLIGMSSMFLGLATVVSSPAMGMGLLAYGGSKFGTSFRTNRNIGKPNHRSKYANQNYYGMEFSSSAVRKMNEIIVQEAEEEVLKLEELNKTKVLRGKKGVKSSEKLKAAKAKRDKARADAAASARVLNVIDKMYGNEAMDSRSLILRGATTIVDSTMGGFGEKLDKYEAAKQERLLKQIAEYQVDALQVEGKAQEVDLYRKLYELDRLSATEDKNVGAFSVSADGNTRLTLGGKPVSTEVESIIQQATKEIAEEKSKKADASAKLTAEERKKIVERAKELAKEQNISIFGILTNATDDLNRDLDQAGVDQQTKDAYMENKKNGGYSIDLKDKNSAENKRLNEAEYLAKVVVGDRINDLIKRAMRELGITGEEGSLSTSLKNRIKAKVKELAQKEGIDLKQYYTEDAKADLVSSTFNIKGNLSLEDAMNKSIEQNIFAQIERKIEQKVDQQIETEIVGKIDGAVNKMFKDNQVKEKRAQTKATEPDKYEEQYELTESERYEIGENVKEFIKKNRYDSVEKIKEKKAAIVDMYAKKSGIDSAEAEIQVNVFMNELTSEKTFKGRVKDTAQEKLKSGEIGNAAEAKTRAEKVSIIQAMRSAVPPSPSSNVSPELVAEQNRVVEGLLSQMSDSYKRNSEISGMYGKKSDSPVDYKQYVKLQGSSSFQTAKNAKKTGRNAMKLSMGEDPTVYGPLVSLDKVVKKM